MASINDWAAKAARHIEGEIFGKDHRGRTVAERPHEGRIAAIIATFAEPLITVVRASRRSHYHCEDSWYCCGKCTHQCDNYEEDHEHDESCYVHSHDGEAARTKGVCNCGADAWNARIDAALDGN